MTADGNTYTLTSNVFSEFSEFRIEGGKFKIGGKSSFSVEATRKAAEGAAADGVEVAKLMTGITDCITKEKADISAEIVLSESPRMVLPLVVCTITKK